MQTEWLRLRDEIARKNGATPAQVEQEIEALIDEMWNGRGRAELLAAGGGQRPTPMQLILHLARYAAAHSDLPKNSTAGFT
ncbi:MAG TPA: sporulation initiation factor Spo0A C-terminal domain-containing protein [Candidatus Anaerofilum faecale]|nr:hypothetical protein [Anaerofilum sp. An201]OUP02444.1 hypothetical protein B5F36_10850 [Anaerofilum sp. An201]HIX13448.1 sporulation initiation factor Spo0A C-terminal domain-containing protein [Candidatus Anaerofilum faecale]